MTQTTQPSTQTIDRLVLALAWLAVLLPLGWGVAQTIKKALALFS